MKNRVILGWICFFSGQLIPVQLNTKTGLLLLIIKIVLLTLARVSPHAPLYPIVGGYVVRRTSVISWYQSSIAWASSTAEGWACL